MVRVLVTGGTGFIGSHTVVVLLEKGFEVVIVDNLWNSSEVVLERIKRITGKDVLGFHRADIRKPEELEEVFRTYTKDSEGVFEPPFDTVIHFAAFKALTESIADPIMYYENNVLGTGRLIQVMQKFNVKNLIFSSSACTYGDERNPDEKTPLRPVNPYGKTKVFGEHLIEDCCNSSSFKPLRALSLRYFNPIGAHPSGIIGEDPRGYPFALMPFISDVITGKRPLLTIHGNDYDTPDGSCVRDFIHIMDLAEGHVAAINFLSQRQEERFYDVFNLGTGKGTSVLQLVEAMRKATQHPIPAEIGPKRAGDVAQFVAKVTKANTILEWFARRDIEESCRDLWNFRTLNPNGYQA